MSRYERFTFLCDENERRLIAELAIQLQRSQSDAVRFVVMRAAQEISTGERSLQDFLLTHKNKKERSHALK